LGGQKFIGDPKQPKISVYDLLDGESDLDRFRNGDRVSWFTFLNPEPSTDLPI
jgi:hypothetical protein